jgi:hypothetical protein
MPDFDSFDDLTSSDPRDSALPVELSLGGQTKTLPWRVDARSAEVLRDRHGIEFDEVLSTIDRVTGSVSEETLREYGIESAEDVGDLSDEERAALEEEIESESTIGGMLDAAGMLLWAGFVRFEPALTKEQVQSAIDLSALSELPISRMLARLRPSADETRPGVEDGDRGK